MKKGTCEVCNQKADYGKLMCQSCLTEFNWEDYADEVDYATYDPDDDKLRIYSGKVDSHLYAALTTLGFQRAYKQGCFFQVWTTHREDAALALCGEIEDEDSTLFDRAEERKIRFASHADSAYGRSASAEKASHEATEGIPFGQPILVGHHSESRHRRAVEKAQQKATEAVQEHRKGEYWQSRAKAVLRHAKYKFAPGTVQRRIEKLERELRKQKRNADPKEMQTRLSWSTSDYIRENFMPEGVFGVVYKVRQEDAPDQWYIVPHEAQGEDDYYYLTEEQNEQAREHVTAYIHKAQQRATRWIHHLSMQITYWKTFLEEEHDIDMDEQWPLRKGYWVRSKRWHAWAQVERVNKSPATKRITTVSIDRDTLVGARSSWTIRKWEYPDLADWKTDTEFRLLSEEDLWEPEPDEKQNTRPPHAEPSKPALPSTVEIVINHNSDFYPTPMDLVEVMIREANITRDSRCLEPSAGDGRIANRMQQVGAMVDCCEIDGNAYRVLQARQHNVVGRDFLEYNPGCIYDAIVMNPPFSKEQDILHVQHAYRCLKPGGALVSIMSEHGFFAGNKLCTEFRDWLEEVEADVTPLPENKFEDYGTRVKTRMVVIHKPQHEIDHEQAWKEYGA